MTRTIRSGLYAGLSILLTACAIPDLQQRTETASEAARQAGWQMQFIETGDFTLLSWHPPAQPTPDLGVYIEGDGLAWINRRRPSDNPTPIRPLAFELALRHPTTHVAYLARPCQYIPIESQTHCKRSAWTGARFSEAVIRSMNTAIDKLKQQFQSERVTLVGYSGGGAVAILLAARRHDVAQLITVAGNLNHSAWTRHHHLQALKGSLNPVDFADKVSGVSQLHFVGADDPVMPADIAASYLSRITQRDNIRVELMVGYDHSCCWVDNWQSLFEKAGQIAKPSR